MNDDYATQGGMGEYFGVGPGIFGKMLKESGLRTKDGKPTQWAFEDGFVAQRPSTQPGTYFYVWHREKTLAWLVKLGYERQDD